MRTHVINDDNMMITEGGMLENDAKRELNRVKSQLKSRPITKNRSAFIIWEGTGNEKHQKIGEISCAWQDEG
jgi:hypothetical protein